MIFTVFLYHKVNEIHTSIGSLLWNVYFHPSRIFPILFSRDINISVYKVYYFDINNMFTKLRGKQLNNLFHFYEKKKLICGKVGKFGVFMIFPLGKCNAIKVRNDGCKNIILMFFLKGDQQFELYL